MYCDINAKSSLRCLYILMLYMSTVLAFNEFTVLCNKYYENVYVICVI